MPKQTKTILGYYVIWDAGDGSANVEFFKEKATADAAVEKAEEAGEMALSDYGSRPVYAEDFQ